MKFQRNRFSSTWPSTYKKNNNHAAAIEAKATIRANVLSEISPKDARVFDAFAGAGEMYSRVWKHAASYVGCDQTWYRDDRECFVADNRLIMRAIDLGVFNIFDLDAYGSPWEQVLIIAARRKIAAGEKIGLVLTEGAGKTVKLGGIPLALQKLTGLRGRLSGAHKSQDEIIDTAIGAASDRMRCGVLKRWQAKGHTGASMRYIGLVLQGAK